MDTSIIFNIGGYTITIGLIDLIGDIILGLILGIFWGVSCKKTCTKKGYIGKENKGFWWGFWLGLIGLIVCLNKKDKIMYKPDEFQQNYGYQQPQPYMQNNQYQQVNYPQNNQYQQSGYHQNNSYQQTNYPNNNYPYQQ